MKAHIFESYSKTFIETFPDLSEEQKFKLISLLLDGSHFAKANDFIINTDNGKFLISLITNDRVRV